MKRFYIWYEHWDGGNGCQPTENLEECIKQAKAAAESAGRRWTKSELEEHRRKNEDFTAVDEVTEDGKKTINWLYAFKVGE